MNSNHKIVSIPIILLLILIFIFVLSSLTPYYADDYTYMYSFADGFGTEMRDVRVTDIPSLIQSQIGHYQCMNGRVVAHTLVQLFLMFDKTIFDVINACAFVILGLLICYHATGKWCLIKPLNLLITYAALLFLAPSFGQSYLWLTGSCNYLFTFVIVLLFLIPYRTNWNKNRKTNIFISILSSLLMLFFGILAGNTNENTGISLFVVLLLYIVMYIIYNHTVKPWMITGCVGTLIGFIVSVFAPGNLIRTNGKPISFSIVSIAKSTIQYTTSTITLFAPLLIGLLILISIIILIKKRQNSLSFKRFKDSFQNHFFVYFYVLFFLGTVYAMTIPAQFPPRAWSHSLALLTIVFLMIFNIFVTTFKFTKNEFKAFKIITTSILIIVIGLTSCEAMVVLRSLNATHNSRTSIIETAIANNQTEVAIPSIVSNSPYVCFDYAGDISTDSDYWQNQGIAHYYQLDKITQSGIIVL